MRIFSLLFLLSFNAQAFIGPGTSAGALFDLVTTTASQLNELEKLVSNAEVYTRQMNEYNRLVRDEYFRAQRVLYLSEQMAKKREVQDLGGLNRAIRELKLNMGSLEHIMKQYSIIQAEEIQTRQHVEAEKRLNQRREEMAKNQVEQSINPRTQSRSNQLTAQNTALLYEGQVEMHDTQLDILRHSSTTNRLLAEKLERERLKEYELKKAYGIEGER